MLLPDYRFHPTSGLRHHRNVPSEPRDFTTAGESALAGYLDQARALLAARAVDPMPWAQKGHAHDERPGACVSSDFEVLWWFELPDGCLA